MNKSKYSDEERQTRRERMLKWWREDPKKSKERIKKMRKGNANYWNNPENRKKQSKIAKERYEKMEIKPSEHTKLHPDLIQEIREQYAADCWRNEISRLLGINIITIRKYLKEPEKWNKK